MELTAEDASRQMLGVFKGIKTTYDQHTKDLAHCNDEYLDLTHALEFLDVDDLGGYELVRQMQVNRRRRRRAKDEIERLQPLYDYLNRQKGMTGELSRLHQVVQDISKNQGKRKYTSRIRTDLQEQFEQSNNNKNREELCE
ncbi:hypothetical protein ACP8HI_04390 [Paenibacillus sp. FA6]|uniref:hypothetical protein n=1 Tax=Paenibacillus sp. FA6 TaxID=3413029 RepID=UPI003F65813E